MVWFFDNIEDYLWDFVDLLYELYSESGDIPVVGGIISGIIYSAYYALWYVAYYCGYFNEWIDDALDDLDDLWDDLGDAWDYIDAIWEDIAAFLTWTQIKNNLEDTYAILSRTYNEIVELGKGAILGTYTSLATWLDAQEDKVVGWVETRFEDILDEVFK